MKVRLNLTKSLTENAGLYFEKYKKSKRKLRGVKQAVEKTKKKIKKKPKPQQPVLEKKSQRKREWYEKFHWSFTQNGLLVIAGRDIKTNQQIVKKHMNENDLYLHADIQGAPSTVLVSNTKTPTPEDKNDAAVIAAVFSKAFALGLGAINVYCVKPDQVKLAAGHGEYLAKGSFVIKGKRDWLNNIPLSIFVSVKDDRVFVSSFKVPKSLEIVPGKQTKSALAKKVKEKLGKWFKAIDLDEILQVIPSSGIVKE